MEITTGMLKIKENMYKKTLFLLAFALTNLNSAQAQTDFRTPAAARTVVEEYYKAIDAGNYRAAYRFWRGNGNASGKTYAKFRQGFSQTMHSRVITGEPIKGSGAMGSTYIDVPVEVFAILKSGRQQRFGGKYTLVRVNDVDGASKDRLHWHLASATLRAQP